MKEIISKVSQKAIKYYGDSLTEEYYKRLKERRLCTTRCKDCKEIWFPPRPFCPKCFSKKIEWVDLPKRGKLYAFTQQERALRFSKPDVIGIVEFDGIGRILTKIDAKFEELKIGMDVELDFIDVDENLTLHQFRPI